MSLRTKYNDYDLSDLKNPTYQEIRVMSEDEMNKVAEEIRLGLLQKWTDKKQPLGGGKKTDEQIVKDFRSLSKFDDSVTLISDEEGNRNVVKFFSKQPSGINQYFPEMLDTPISLGNKHKSVMDVIKSTEDFQKFFRSIVYTDRMYSFTMWYDSKYISKETFDLLGDKIPYQYKDDKNKDESKRFDGWKLPFFFKNEKDGSYWKLENKSEKTNSNYIASSEKEYENNMRIFPQITQSFRLGGGSQPVSNFSAGAARFLIRKGFENAMEKGIIEKDKFVVLDPSTGWAGRMVGLLSIHSELRRIYRDRTGRDLTVIYLTTDPNEEIKDRYSDILEDWFSVIEPTADKKYFYMFKDISGSETYEFLQFCKTRLLEWGLKGVTMGLTSPPYFNRERYSKDENQSWVKYGTSYESWSKGFLKPTVENISQLLLKNGMFFMNIANINHNSKSLPLEQDTKEYADEYWCSCNENKFKMLMSTMTGNNKDAKGTGGKPANSVKLAEGWRKFEPIFILVGGAKPIMSEMITKESIYPDIKPTDHPDTGFPESMTEEEEKLSSEIIDETGNKFELPTKEQLTNTIEQLDKNIEQLQQDFVTKVEKIVTKEQFTNTIEQLAENIVHIEQNFVTKVTVEKKVEKSIDDADDWFDKYSEGVFST